MKKYVTPAIIITEFEQDEKIMALNLTSSVRQGEPTNTLTITMNS